MEKRKFRHETKHYISYSDYLSIKKRLDVIAQKDAHSNEQGLYFIRSLYFDNYNDKILREKNDGLNCREKFRIRFYNGDVSNIKLEKKSKVHGLCNKLSTIITKDQVEKIIRGDIEFLAEEKNPVFIDLYTKMRYQNLKPKVVVDYTREPFVYKTGNVRITFDTNVKTGLVSKDIFNMDLATVSVTEPDQILMEVKYDAFLPEVIAMCLQVRERPAKSFSKYAACRKYI